MKQNKKQRKFLAWVGDNASLGNPHPITGRCCCNGDLLVFSSEKERKAACEVFDYKYNRYPVPTNRKEAKSYYCAGMSQRNFGEWLYHLPVSTIELD